jgi:CHASE2 domain-containing sensor protein
MALAGELFRAVALTLALGIGVILASDFFPSKSWVQPFLVLAMALSVLAGVLLLARRRRQHIIPIAAIYFVVMFGVLIYVAFLIAWQRGQVEM